MGKKQKIEPLSESSDTSELSDNDESIETNENLKHKKFKTSAVDSEPADLAASDTESDDDDDDDEENDDDEEDGDAVKSKEPILKSKIENIKAKIEKKYASTKGKQLFIRFPEKLPLDVNEFQKKVRSLTPLIVNAHKPRQRHARFCLVDFATQDDRDVFFTHLSKSAKKKDGKYDGIVAALPRTESENFLEDLVQKKLQSLENKKAKMRLRKAAKIADRTKNFTSTIVILNLPQNATNADVSKLFSNAIDIQLRPPKGRYYGPNVAAITFPTTMDARAAAKRKLKIGNTKLIVKFALEPTKKKKNKNKQKKNQNKLKKGKKTTENTKDALVPDGQTVLLPKNEKIQLQKTKNAKQDAKQQPKLKKQQKLVTKNKSKTEDKKLQTVAKENPKMQKKAKKQMEGQVPQQIQPKNKITKILGLENGDLVKQVKKTQIKKNIRNAKVKEAANNKQSNNQKPPKQQQKSTKVLGLHKKGDNKNKKLKQKVKKLTSNT